jgi:hypothetical protein
MAQAQAMSPVVVLIKLGLETNADLVRFVIRHGLDTEGGTI